MQPVAREHTNICTDIHTESENRLHPVTISGVFPSTRHQGAVQQANTTMSYNVGHTYRSGHRLEISALWPFGWYQGSYLHVEGTNCVI